MSHARLPRYYDSHWTPPCSNPEANRNATLANNASKRGDRGDVITYRRRAEAACDDRPRNSSGEIRGLL